MRFLLCFYFRTAATAVVFQVHLHTRSTPLPFLGMSLLLLFSSPPLLVLSPLHSVFPPARPREKLNFFDFYASPPITYLRVPNALRPPELRFSLPLPRRTKVHFPTVLLNLLILDRKVAPYLSSTTYGFPLFEIPSVFLPHKGSSVFGRCPTPYFPRLAPPDTRAQNSPSGKALGDLLVLFIGLEAYPPYAPESPNQLPPSCPLKTRTLTYCVSQSYMLPVSLRSILSRGTQKKHRVSIKPDDPNSPQKTLFLPF